MQHNAAPHLPTGMSDRTTDATDPSPRQGTSERNLLLGMLALQLDFITREQLLAAAAVWMQDKKAVLADVLVKHGALTSDVRNVLEALAEKHIQAHSNDLAQSLAAIGDAEATCSLQQLNDPELTTSLRHVRGSSSASGDSPYATVAYSPPHDQSSRFHILRLHAQGGLGRVLAARDGELNREVVVKEIRPERADDPDSRQRFILEAEVTGGLEHPGVAPVYCLGRFPDGRPFYAMRFIRGESLDEALRKSHAQKANPAERRLAQRRLLGHIIDVCHTLEYAHCRGVLHRDIKPANIMLGAYGETLVVDWGLAKLVGRDDIRSGPRSEKPLTPRSLQDSPPTLEGSVVGTPAYMSPEQAEGRMDLLCPASDVYSLGATLFCVLTGQPPIAAKSTAEALQKVRQGELLDARALDPSIPRPLTAICRKALARSLTERYARASDLADDLERFLADEPVSAHQESFIERAARWVRRHRSWATAGAATVLIVAVVSTVAAVLVEQQRQRAVTLAHANEMLAESEKAAHQEAERRRKEALGRLHEARDAVDTWLTGAAAVLEQTPGAEASRRQMLEQAAAHYERFAQSRTEDAELQLEAARTRFRLGRIRYMLGDSGAAEREYQRAESALEKLLAGPTPQKEARLELANCRTEQAILCTHDNRFEDAERLFQRATDDLGKLAAEGGRSAGQRQALGVALLNRGMLEVRRGGLDDARTYLQEASDAFAPLLKEKPTRTDAQSAASTVQLLLGDVANKLGDPAAARRHMEAALDSFNSLVQAEEEPGGHRSARAETLVYLAGVLRREGDQRRELEAFQQALADYEALLLNGALRLNYVLTRADYAQLLLETGQATAASQALDAALRETLALKTAYPDDPTCVELEAGIRDMWGEASRDAGDYEQARTLHMAAIPILEQLAQANPDTPGYLHRLAVARSHLGQALHALEQYEPAEAALLAAAADFERLMSLSSPIPDYYRDVGYVYRHLGNLYFAQERRADAARAYAKARELWQDAADRSPLPDHQRLLVWLFACCPDPSQHDVEQARTMAQSLLNLHPESPPHQHLWGVACLRAGETQAAIAALQKAQSLRLHPDPRDGYYLSLALFQQGDRAGAVAAFGQADQRLAESRPGDWELQRLRRETAQTLELDLDQ